MDRRQERVAEHLGWGYRILRGVAGSGKTLVLTHRARHLHRLFPNWNILLLCYNRLLANALERMVDPSDRLNGHQHRPLGVQVGRKPRTGRGLPDFGELRRSAAEKRPRMLSESEAV